MIIAIDTRPKTLNRLETINRALSFSLLTFIIASRPV